VAVVLAVMVEAAAAELWLMPTTLPWFPETAIQLLLEQVVQVDLILLQPAMAVIQVLAHSVLLEVVKVAVRLA
jgi:hypothetical protein